MRTRLSILLATAAVLAACGGGGGGGGAKLALGTEATVAYTSAASGSTPAANTTLGITVTKVRKGALEDLTSAGLEPEDKNTTPYYVDVHYTNKGNGPVPKNLDVGMEDKDGNSIPTTLNFAFGADPFALCEEVTKGTLEPGESYDSCTLLLVPNGKTPDRVRFVSQGPDNKITFTDWAAG